MTDGTAVPHNITHEMSVLLFTVIGCVGPDGGAFIVISACCVAPRPELHRHG